MKKTLLTLSLLAAYSIGLQAQFISAKLYINGLTCSLCSMGIEKSLLKLPFVDHISMDLNDNLAEIIFKSPSIVQIDEISKKVVDAGFSVRSLEASYNFKDLLVYEESSFIANDNKYIFKSVNKQLLNGVYAVKFIGKKYMDPKTYAIWKNKVAGANQNKNQTVYSITL